MQAPLRTTHAHGTPKNLLVHDRWNGYGRPVLLLHGLRYDRTMWWPVAADLGSSCTAVAVDLPGHGASAARGADGLDMLVHDLVMLINGLDLRRAPIVVGHAEAALIAGAFAERYATQAVITVDEIADGAPAVIAGEPSDEDLSVIPEMYRQFAVPRTDTATLDSYRDWFSRTSPRVRVGAAARAHAGGERFPHLRDPAAFAAVLRGVS